MRTLARVAVLRRLPLDSPVRSVDAPPDDSGTMRLLRDDFEDGVVDKQWATSASVTETDAALQQTSPTNVNSEWYYAGPTNTLDPLWRFRIGGTVLHFETASVPPPATPPVYTSHAQHSHARLPR